MILEDELDASLGYVKNKKSNDLNLRNSYASKTIKTHIRDTQIQVVRDREYALNLILIKNEKSIQRE